METNSPEKPTGTIYRAPEEIVRQGDIIQLAPVGRATREHLHVGQEQKKTVAGKTARSAWLLEPADLPTKIATGQQASRLVVPGILSWAILLTRGCDIENSDQRQVAFLRPLKDFGADAMQASIIDGKHTSLHFLPEAAVNGGAQLFADSVVDFRFVITLHRELFDQLARPIGLAHAALKDVYLSWLRHTTGKFISITVPCGSCGTPVPVFQEVQAMANPPDDF